MIKRAVTYNGERRAARREVHIQAKSPQNIQLHTTEILTGSLSTAAEVNSVKLLTASLAKWLDELSSLFWSSFTISEVDVDTD